MQNIFKIESADELMDPKKNEPNSISSIPQKSRDVYEKEYKLFSTWCIENSYEKITENALLGYFEERSKTLKPNSLLTKYSMLRSMLVVKNNIDITTFSHLMKFLKDSKKFDTSIKRSSFFSREQMNAFIRDAPDDVYLMVKVSLIFGVAGSMSCVELCNITIDDIEDFGTSVVFNITDPYSDSPRVARIIDEGEDSLNYAHYYRKYAALRPFHINHRRFFIKYANGECSSQVVGQNTFGKVPFAAAKFLRLPNPENYTGRCFKKLCKTLGVDVERPRSLSSAYGLQ